MTEEDIGWLLPFLHPPPNKPPTDTEITKRHTPFYSEGSIPAGQKIVLNIRSDDEQGLGTVGRSGWIENTGSNSLKYTIYDGNGKSKEITLDAGDLDSYRREDDIWFDKVTLYSEIGTTYRCEFTR